MKTIILITIIGMISAWYFGYKTGRIKGFQEGFWFKNSRK